MANAEAPFSFTTKFDGDLLTIRGNDIFDFIGNLKAVDTVATVKRLVATIEGTVPTTTEQAVANVQQAIPQAVVVEEYVQPQVAPAFAPVPPPQAVPQQAPAAPACAHGGMKLMPAGISKKTGKPYSAFYVCQWPNREEQCKSQPAS